MIAIPASAVALAAGQADAQSAIQFTLDPHQIAYGHDVTVKGSASPGTPGELVYLEFAPRGATRWQTLSSTHVAADGRFRMVAPLRHSGLLRVSGAGTTSAATTTPVAAVVGSAPTGGASTTAGTSAGSSAGTSAGTSASQSVTVAASLRVSRQSASVLQGQPVDVRGRLLPAKAGRRVQLRGRTGSGWQTLATARTGGNGGFDLHFVPGSTGQESLRIRFQGDRLNAKGWAEAGQVTVYRQSVASWYDDGGSTACGFHAYYGVANRDLPCGTKVTFRYGGKTVAATVDDRGPFVGGRDWDLNQNTAAALGFGGVDTVWSSV